MTRPSQLALMIALAVAVPFAAAPAFAATHDGVDHAAAQATAPAPSALAQALRTLWLGHVEATRNYLIAAHDKQADQASAAADQVVANATAIADAVAGFYGKAAGEQMLTLLAGHWGAVKAYTDASVTPDDAARTQAMADLNSNAKTIADFLSGANPNLPQPALLGLLTAHGAHHIAQIQQVVAGDMAAEAKTGEMMRAHMVVIADALADGISKQFPDKTKG